MSIVFIYVISFFSFAFCQSLIILGVYECFKGGCRKEMVDGKVKEVCTGMILYPIARWLNKVVKNPYYLNPVFGCYKCMSSLWGGLTFWPITVYLFGFHLIEVLIFVWDAFILVVISDYIYKKL